MTKTTRIYVGSSSRRAGRAYDEFLFKQREALKLKRKRQTQAQTQERIGPCEAETSPPGPVAEWRDIEAFAKAYEPGDVFDETGGPGAHLVEGTRKTDPGPPIGAGLAS